MINMLYTFVNCLIHTIVVQSLNLNVYVYVCTGIYVYPYVCILNVYVSMYFCALVTNGPRKMKTSCRDWPPATALLPSAVDIPGGIAQLILCFAGGRGRGRAMHTSKQ